MALLRIRTLEFLSPRAREEQIIRLIPMSQVDQYLALAGRSRNGAEFDFFGRDGGSHTAL
jgi:hypothetical protein